MSKEEQEILLQTAQEVAKNSDCGWEAEMNQSTELVKDCW